MNALLPGFEADGYSFRLEGNSLAVKAPCDLLNTQALDQIRQYREALIDEVMIRNFCKLVQSFGVNEHHMLLEPGLIAGDLPEQTAAELRDTSQWERQQWAALMAFRLCRDRAEENNRPGWRTSPGECVRPTGSAST